MHRIPRQELCALPVIQSSIPPLSAEVLQANSEDRHGAEIIATEPLVVGPPCDLHWLRAGPPNNPTKEEVFLSPPFPPMKKNEEINSRGTLQAFPFIPELSTWGVSWSPPSAGPLLSLGRGESAPHRRGGPVPAPKPFPLLSSLRSAPTSRGPGLGAAMAPRSSFSGSGRVPRRWAARLQEPGPAPASGLTNSAVRVTAASNPRGSRLRVPPPELQHPSDHGLG